MIKKIKNVSGSTFEITALKITLANNEEMDIPSVHSSTDPYNIDDFDSPSFNSDK